MIVVQVPHLLAVLEVSILSCSASIDTFVVAILVLIRVWSINDQEVSDYQIFFICHYYDISTTLFVVTWPIDEFNDEHYSERLAHGRQGIFSTSYLLVGLVIHSTSHLGRALSSVAPITTAICSSWCSINSPRVAVRGCLLVRDVNSLTIGGSCCHKRWVTKITQRVPLKAIHAICACAMECKDGGYFLPTSCEFGLDFRIMIQYCNYLVYSKGVIWVHSTITFVRCMIRHVLWEYIY